MSVKAKRMSKMLRDYVEAKFRVNERRKSAD